MSQFPLEGGNPVAGRLRRDRGRQMTDGGGITQTLDAPGLVPLPAVATKGQQMASELAQALGMVGSAADAVRQFSAVETSRLRQQTADLNQKANEIEAADRGAANLLAQSRAPELERKILAGELSGNGEEDDVFAESLLSGQIPEGMSPEYRDQYVKSLKPKLMDALSNRRKAGIERARTAQQELIFAEAAGVESPARLGRIVDAAVGNNPDLPRSVALAAATKSALSFQAKAGTEQSFNEWVAVASKTPGVAAEDITEARTTYRQRVAVEDSIKTQHFQDEIADGMLKAQRGETSLDFVRSEAERRWSKQIKPEALKAGLDRIDAERASRRMKIGEEEKKQLKRDWDAALIDQVSAHMADAINTGGAATLPAKLEATIRLDDGSTLDVSMTPDEAVKTALNRDMETIARTRPPAEAFAAQVELASRNGVVYDGWAKPMQAGAATLFSDIASTDPSKELPVPANLAKGFELYKQLGAVNPVLRDRHVGQNTQAADLYATAQVAQEEITDGDPRAAMAIAVRAARRRASPSFQETDIEEIRMAASNNDTWTPFDNEDINNSTDVGERIIRIAKVYVEGTGISPSRAVEKAVERVKGSMVVLNNWAVNTEGRTIPPNLDVVASDEAKNYVARNPDSGVDESDLTLIPGPTDRTWILYNKALERPVENWTKTGFFTDAQLMQNSQDAQAREAATGKTKTWGRFLKDQYRLRGMLTNPVPVYTMPPPRL